MKMPRILYRYLLKDFFYAWVALFAGLTVITMVGQLPTILGRAADHEIAPHLILEVLMLMLVANAPVLMLLTLLLAGSAATARSPPCGLPAFRRSACSAPARCSPRR
jgi:lipopolysaccharide export LptBFGC system permease protein LptF